jgi:hypothetical protein
VFRKVAPILVGLVIVALGLDYACRHWLAAFDADRIALAETRMWKAYYSGDTQSLGSEMVALLNRQFGLSLTDAMEVGRDLAGAAMTFQGLSGNYEQVLPGLERAYSRLKKSTGGTWDSAAAARAELDWWITRRTPGRDSPEEVGRAIARLYAILYGKTNPDIERAGLLRAQAAALRDSGAARADWAEVERLLRQSYHALASGIKK